MNFEENTAHWEGVRRKLAAGAKPTANAMAQYLVTRAKKDTLGGISHAPGAWHRTKAGEAPARSTGNLARHMYYRPAWSGVRATAVVGNDAEYSRALEFGCVITPVFKKSMHWKDSGSPVTGWFHKMLVIPPHPYVSRTTDEAIDDGELQEAGMVVIREYDP